MPTIVGILTFISRINYRLWNSKLSIYLTISVFMSSLNFLLGFVEHEKSFTTSGPGDNQRRLFQVTDVSQLKPIFEPLFSVKRIAFKERSQNDDIHDHLSSHIRYKNSQFEASFNFISF